MSNQWSLSYSSEAARQLRDMDRSTSRRLVKYLEERVVTLDDPRQNGKALRGSQWGECWRYRCGDYRIIVKILDADLIVMILRVGHRKIYTENCQLTTRTVLVKLGASAFATDYPSSRTRFLSSAAALRACSGSPTLSTSSRASSRHRSRSPRIARGTVG